MSPPESGATPSMIAYYLLIKPRLIANTRCEDDKAWPGSPENNKAWHSGKNLLPEHHALSEVKKLSPLRWRRRRPCAGNPVPRLPQA